MANLFIQRIIFFWDKSPQDDLQDREQGFIAYVQVSTEHPENS